MAKHKKGQACRLPWFGKEGKRWQCQECGARFIFTVSTGTNKHGQKIKGHGSWVQWGG
jgi:hypothetical protein